jgi:hypothetical protein
MDVGTLWRFCRSVCIGHACLRKGELPGMFETTSVVGVGNGDGRYVDRSRPKKATSVHGSFTSRSRWAMCVQSASVDLGEKPHGSANLPCFQLGLRNLNSRNEYLPR